MNTSNRAHDVSSYQFQAGEEILIDANVWLYLLPPAESPAPAWTKRYTAAYRNLVDAHARPVIDALILSEYCNACLRIVYNKSMAGKYSGFKEFRDSSDGKITLEDVARKATQIQQRSLLKDTTFSSINLTSVLHAFSEGSIDFNDGILLENCRLNNWKMLTNDGDMTLGGIEVLTANRRLLDACPA